MSPATNQFILGIALGENASAPQYRLTCTALDLRVATEAAQREESSTSRDAGERVITQRAVTGGFTTILRPMTAPLLYYAILGAKAASLRGVLWAGGIAKTVGSLVRPTATANKDLFEATVAGTTHTAEPAWPSGVGSTVVDGTVTWTNRGAVQNNHTLTPAQDQPWVTLWRFLYGGFAEKFKSCKLMSGQLTGGADQNNGDLMLQVGAIGKDAEDIAGTIAFDPYDPAAAGAGTFDAGSPVRWFGCTTNVDGTDNPNVDQFQNTVNADQNAAKTKAITYGKIEPGRRNIEHQYQLVFDTAEARTAYKRSAYGGSAITAPSDVVAEEVLDYAFVDAAGAKRMTLAVPRFSVVGDIELPVNPNGEMGRVGVVGGADRPSAGAIQAVTFQNSVASY